MRKFSKMFVILVLLLACFAFSAAAEGLLAGIVTATAGLKLRPEANTTCTPISVIPYKSDVTIFEEKDGFFKVSFAGSVGYASAEYINSKEIMNIENGGGAKITATALNLRSKPEKTGTVMAKLPENSITLVIGVNNGWLKVITTEGTGYISPEWVNFVPLTAAESVYYNVKPVVIELTKEEKLVKYAKQYLGYRYIYGGQSPSGFDCSGFTYFVYKNFGIKLNRNSAAQMSNGYKVSRSELKLGDLIFFNTLGASYVNHVGIYIGNGSFIHASTPTRGVVIDSLFVGYYSTVVYAYRRIF